MSKAKVAKVEDGKDDENKCDKRGTRNYARYYDSPDGCYVQQKMMVCARYGVVAGLIAGTYDVIMYSHAVGFGNIMKRYMKHVIPISAMGMTFAAVANGVQQLRNVDDPLNYFAGGFACGPILAWYLGSGHAVVAGGIFLGLIAVLKKEGVDREYSFIPKFSRHMNTIRSWRNDWSLVKDPRDDMRHTCTRESDSEC